MWVRFLGWEDPLKEVMATHFSILAWRIPWTQEPGQAAVQRVAESDTEESLKQLSMARHNDSTVRPSFTPQTLK